MKKKKTLFLICFITIVIISGLWPFTAAAQEHACQIKAHRDNIHLYVRDFDRDGNPTRRILFRGWLLQGRTVSIKSLSGRISISFKADSDKRGSGSNELKCSGNQTHSLP
jgi:hypothetical protein